MSSEASVRADVLQELIEGYMVAPETLDWPRPIRWPTSWTITPSMPYSLLQPDSRDE